MSPSKDPPMFDIIVIGAGLSGINAAYRIQQSLPHKSFAILESRAQIGGTWDFWKYPGARTDSTMALFGFDWYPWTQSSNMARAGDLRQYIEDAAVSEGIDTRIRFRHRMTTASWSSAEQCWTLEVEVSHPDSPKETKTIKTSWLICATGYYSYDKALPAEIPGLDTFAGDVIHPQWWDDSVSHAGKRVVVIGSGATAITLVPALASSGVASVTMLQRSPSYVFALAGRMPRYPWDRFLPASWSYRLRWWMQMTMEVVFVGLLSTFPNFARRFLQSEMRKKLPEGFDVATHFNPRYDVFQQRLCFCPSADFFKALHRDNVSIVTDTISTVTPTGIKLTSGKVLEADIIITATGLYLELLSGIQVFVDGTRFDRTIGSRYVWNNTMLDGLPNAGQITGYVATTWTPGADVRTRQLIKVIRHMDRTGAVVATPWLDEKVRKSFPDTSAMPLTSTYAIQGRDRVPRSAFVGPWRSGVWWLSDLWNYWFGTVTQGVRYTYGKGKDD
ncbi:hypothetical protein QBC47DRAFT_389057 [Echria macrotheca]|uniref:Uncharacterized protein n=1 Tax=Echria macrotheca TaxID=438768 RepID=A0AAJ0B7J1_9PEZI|nr:hypothetical protein QBC47DRAFT_389057 [Echria macrotheca]